ncbi:MAG: hypothetical protein Hyperionvirus3_129 [Hyperionvirus sp.]|uniref:Uncharacterized protein n=1 Tax=Hyperionvirus sp. TaxID=2487770 RepID=A0A3G5AAW7_9VIRU|nr:MAG: hypothetical protein Hyperionvirus3_129 [Hyperionvirus sp.]
MGNTPHTIVKKDSNVRVLPPFDFDSLYNGAISFDVHTKNKCLKYIEYNEDPQAYYLLGLYYFGRSKEWNTDLAMKYFLKAIEGGNKEALMNYALSFYYGNSFSECTKMFFRKTATPPERWLQIDCNPYLNIGETVAEIKEFEQDRKKSFELLMSAHENSASITGPGRIGIQSYVCEFLSYHYEDGGGCGGVNMEKALEYAKMSYNLLSNHFLKESRKPSKELDNKVHNIQGLLMKIGKLESDEVLQFMLMGDKEKIDHNINIARVYEARGNYVEAVKYCMKEKIVLEEKGTFDQKYDAKEYEQKMIILKKRQLENTKSPGEIKSADEIKQLKDEVAELKGEIVKLISLVAKPIAHAVSVDAVVPPIILGPQPDAVAGGFV